MRAFIGHKMKIATRALGLVEGVMVDDRPTMILVRGNDNKITRIIKADIGSFVPIDFEPFNYLPFLVLFCENKKARCPGIQCIKDGEGFSQSDINAFMSPCPCKSEDCTMGTKGELRTVDSEFLRNMLAGTLFGEYPKKEKKDGGTRHSAAIAEIAKSKIKGGGAVEREQPDHGREVGIDDPEAGT